MRQFLKIATYKIIYIEIRLYKYLYIESGRTIICKTNTAPDFKKRLISNEYHDECHGILKKWNYWRDI
jgi:hypothetical protein